MWNDCFNGCLELRLIAIHVNDLRNFPAQYLNASEVAELFICILHCKRFSGFRSLVVSPSGKARGSLQAKVLRKRRNAAQTDRKISASGGSRFFAENVISNSAFFYRKSTLFSVVLCDRSSGIVIKFCVVSCPSHILLEILKFFF